MKIKPLNDRVIVKRMETEDHRGHHHPGHRAQIEETTTDYDREKLQERLAKIIGGVAVINIGAASETEMKEKKARMEDALNATRAAVEEGVVPGGGVALVRCVNALEDIKAKGEEKSGIAILKRALTEPLKQIAENAGHEGSVVLNKVLEGKDDFGFNAQSRRVRKSAGRRRHRSHQGGALCHSERSLGVRTDAYHRGHDRRKAGEEKRTRHATGWNAGRYG